MIDIAIQAAVKEKRLWLITGHSSFFAEDLPLGVLAEDAYLLSPPKPIPASEVLPASLPEAWSDEITTALDIANTLSTKVGKMLPWITVREAIDEAFRSRLLERTVDSSIWPCDYAGARSVKISLLRLQSLPPSPPVVREPPEPTFASGVLVVEAPLRVDEIQNLNDVVGDLTKAAVGLNLQFHLRVELSPAAQVSEETIGKMNELLAEVSEKLRL